MLLSKRAEMFLPEQWPAYFSRAKGCRVWDLDGRELIDMSIMGIGTNLLGYDHPEIDAAVASAVAAGNMSTLNCPEEVRLAERLVALHPGPRWLVLPVAAARRMRLRYALLAQPQGEKRLLFVVITAGTIGTWLRIFKTTPDWRNTCCRGLNPTVSPVV